MDSPAPRSDELFTSNDTCMTVPPSSPEPPKKRKQQPRPLLSCTRCRARKCDRRQPCDTCCKGHVSAQCEYVVPEGGDYGPIQQAFELKDLRDENRRLKSLLKDAGVSLSRVGSHVKEGSVDKLSSPIARQRRRKSRSKKQVDSWQLDLIQHVNVPLDFSGSGDGRALKSKGGAVEHPHQVGDRLGDADLGFSTSMSCLRGSPWDGKVLNDFPIPREIPHRNSIDARNSHTPSRHPLDWSMAPLPAAPKNGPVLSSCAPMTFGHLPLRTGSTPHLGALEGGAPYAFTPSASTVMSVTSPMPMFTPTSALAPPVYNSFLSQYSQPQMGLGPAPIQLLQQPVQFIPFADQFAAFPAHVGLDPFVEPDLSHMNLEDMLMTMSAPVDMSSFMPALNDQGF